MEASKKLGIKLRQELMEPENNYNWIKDEFTTCKHTLERTKSDTDTATARISSHKKEIAHNTKKLSSLKAYDVALEEKLKTVTATALSEEDRAFQIEQFLQNEEHFLKELEVLLRHCREELFQHKDQLKTLRSREKNAFLKSPEAKGPLASLNKSKDK